MRYDIQSSVSGTMNILRSPLEGSWLKRAAPSIGTAIFFNPCYNVMHECANGNVNPNAYDSHTVGQKCLNMMCIPFLGSHSLYKVFQKDTLNSSFYLSGSHDYNVYNQWL